jgi:hypothetical protein
MDDVLDWIGQQLLRAEREPIQRSLRLQRSASRFRGWTRLHARISIVAAVLAATVACAAVADAAGVLNIPALWQQEPNVPSPEGTATSIQPGLASAYAILRTPRNPTIDALPDNPNGVGAITVPGGGGGHYGANPALSRLAGTIDGQSFWLVPGNLGSCVDSTSDGSICTSNARMSSEGTLGLLASTTGGTDSFWGIVPDSATVTATNRDGSPAPVSRSGNAFIVSGDPNLQGVTIHEADGHESTNDVPSV